MGKSVCARSVLIEHGRIIRVNSNHSRLLGFYHSLGWGRVTLRWRWVTMRRGRVAMRWGRVCAAWGRGISSRRVLAGWGWVGARRVCPMGRIRGSFLR